MSDRPRTHASFRHIDAFASKPFEGNSAAVYQLDAFPPDYVMLKIAREHNLSETAWIVPDDSGEADYQLRWFTPAVEVELCGHATLASGHAVLTDEPDRDAVSFRTLKGAGVLTVLRAEDGYALNLPASETQPRALDGLAAALGAPPAEIRVTTDRAEDSVLIIYETAAEVRALKPDFNAMASFGNLLFIATAPGGDGDADDGIDVVSRVFAPGAGINEDPVTGSAHAILTPYWTARLGRDDFYAFQASERGGHVMCRRDGGRAILGGTCVDVIHGTLLV